METLELKKRWDKLKKENPRLRIRNAAEKIGVSEVELLATKIGETVVRLRNEHKSILKDLIALEKVMALTRNKNCVHERKGVYKNPRFEEDSVIGVFVSKDIDLRLFFNHWDSVFAVEEPMGDNVRRSIQFFSKDGLAIHKVYLTKDSNVDEYQKLIEKYKSDNQDIGQKITRLNEEKKYVTDEEVDLETFHKEWKELKHTHDFSGVLRKHNLGRVQALRLAPEEYYAKKINKENVVEMLEKVSEIQTPIMVFTGNKGMIQIHSGKVNKLMWHNEWFNILDPDFNMHLNMDGIDQVWLVRKPTNYGVISSIEVFDKDENTIVQFFGKRVAKGQSDDWHNTVDNLKN